MLLFKFHCNKVIAFLFRLFFSKLIELRLVSSRSEEPLYNSGKRPTLIVFRLLRDKRKQTNQQEHDQHISRIWESPTQYYELSPYSPNWANRIRLNVNAIWDTKSGEMKFGGMLGQPKGPQQQQIGENSLLEGNRKGHNKYNQQTEDSLLEHQDNKRKECSSLEHHQHNKDSHRCLTEECT